MQPTQIERPFRLKTTLGDDVLVLDSFTGEERISTPFHFVFRLLAHDANIDIKALLEKPAVLSLKLEDESERHIHGLFNRFRLLEYGEDGMAAYEAEMVPWLWFLNLFSDCKIFQYKTVREIVEKIFKDRGFTDYDFRLQGSYEPREYCVQYRETDFNFVSRLLEEEGIFYFFEQTEDKHTLVIADAKSAIALCPHKAKARFTPATGGNLERETVLGLEQEYRVIPGTVSLKDYDFQKPLTNLYATVLSQEKGENYDYPGLYTTKAQGDHYSRIRLEEREVRLVTAHGNSTCMGFECGYKFTLEEHFREKANGDHVLVGLRHGGQNPSYRSGHVEAFAYSNVFEAIPADVVFRPPSLSAKPRIHGTQTAVVVGKSGEEIWTDKYGRVTVQFYWDRQGTVDEKSSCWIRVAQGWAGKQWGAIYIPRIGQEVVVSFLEGDPDRPLITGSVYNADQTVPYALPAEQTKSTMKSHSSKGGGGYNEIRLEDKKGYEQIFIHGEMDLDVRIKNNRRESIGYDRHLVVERDKLEYIKRDSHSWITRDRIEKIARDHHLEIVGKEAIKITGSQSIQVTGDVAEEFMGSQSTQVTEGVYIKGLDVVIEGLMGLTLKVGGNFITLNAAGIQISGMPLVLINSGGAPLSGTPGTVVPPLSPTYADEADDAYSGYQGSPYGGSYKRGGMPMYNVSPGKKSSPYGHKDNPYAPTHDPYAPANKDKKHHIEIELHDEYGKPVPGEPYKITLPDGTVVADGTTNEKGYARVDNIDPGTCKVTFPNLDKDAWKPK